MHNAWIRARQGLALGALLTLLFFLPQAVMRGVADGLALWAQAVLPAILPFFVLTSLMQAAGALDALSPALRPLCALFRLPPQAGGLLAAGWLTGAPGGVRLLQGGLLAPGEAARYCAAATVTSPLFLVGTVGLYLGSPALGAMVYGIHFLCALCNGALWRGYGGAARPARGSAPRPAASIFRALPEALRSSCLSALFIGGAIAVFSGLTCALEAAGAQEALRRTLLFALPGEALPPLTAGFFEVSNGCRLAAQAALPLPLRLSLLCALAAFGGISVLCQAQVFLDGAVRPGVYFAQRCTHAALSFAACRAFCLFFGGALPAFAAQTAVRVSLPASHLAALPVLALCMVFSLLPWWEKG